MTLTRHKPRDVLPSDSIVPLESVLGTEELNQRPARPPDYKTENRALVSLAQALAESPRTFLQALADKILEVFQAGSAGISLLTKEDGGKRFYWPAIAGLWKPHIGGGTPREFGPCGDVLDRNAPLLFKHPERRYTYFLPVTPPVEECLLVPFYVEGKAVGTIWTTSHDDRRKFDAEDLRQLVSLGSFASSAYRVTSFLDALEQQGETLRQNEIERADSMAELRKANVQAQESRRAALNLMEDAVGSRQAMQTLNLELRRSEERYRTLFELGPVAVYSCDAAGVIQDFNRRAVELWGREPKPGDTDERFCGSFKMHRPDGSFMPHEQCPIVEVLRTGISARNVEVCIERPDGSRLPVIANFGALKNAEGEITGAITSLMDITERKQAEETMRQAKEILSDEAVKLESIVNERTAALRETVGELEAFSYSVAHDMRAPLRGMQGFARMLLEEHAGQLDAQAHSYLERIVGSAFRMDSLIRDVLNYTRVLQANTELTPVDLDKLVRDVVATYPDWQPPTAEIQVEGTIPAVRGHEGFLTQCVSNLIGNAVKFVTPDTTPRVRIWAEECSLSPGGEGGSEGELTHQTNPRFVRVWFEDNGIGIAPEDHDRIFRMFERINPIAEFEGTGIGLTIVRKAVERMGGKLGFESQLGQGSKFWIQLMKG